MRDLIGKGTFCLLKRQCVPLSTIDHSQSSGVNPSGETRRTNAHRETRNEMGFPSHGPLANMPDVAYHETVKLGS